MEVRNNKKIDRSNGSSKDRGSKAKLKARKAARDAILERMEDAAIANRYEL